MPQCNLTFENELRQAVKGDSFWESYIDNLKNQDCLYNLHLAILVEPYLTFILEGKKTIESRFASVKCAPYGSVKKGDIVLLKKSGGPIVGLCLVGQAWFYKLDELSLRMIQSEFSKALCALTPDFWEERKNKSYASLMRINNVKTINPIIFNKRDRRGWVILKEFFKYHQLSFGDKL
jgi:hypothetical protein